MRFLSVLVVALVTYSVATAQSKSNYTYTIDLTKVVNDRVYVELTPPALSQKEVTFYLPKIVPGTYAIEDYGRYVQEFSATDKKGKKLNVEKVDENSWKIKDAHKLAKISYWVDDSFDTKVSGPEIFWPAGTNIEDSKNYIVNTGGFFGYFDGVKDVPFRFNVIRSKDFYGTTGLIATQNGQPLSSLKLEKTSSDPNKVVDVYQARDYDQLVDSPLMYAKPDTAVINVAGTEVLIGTYSPNNKINSKEIAGSLTELLMAQKEYLGGKLPVEKYAFIIYFTDQPVNSYGALEHSYSSLYYLPEGTIEQWDQQIKDIAAHEFFHIVTPLTIHSEEIQDFDFNKPKMSKHLWMYEGVTEYFAFHAQVKGGLITPEHFLQSMREKIIGSEHYRNDVPFTDISKYTLDKYPDQYANVYQKGALIGMCLDIKLRQLSQGKYGVRNLLTDLSKKYGKDKAFKDDELFDEITKMTYPEIGEFFKRYVAGTEMLPIEEVLTAVGVIYKAEQKTMDYSIGISQDNIDVTELEGKQKLVIASTANGNQVAQDLGFKEGDILIKMNGEILPELGPDFGAFIQRQMASLPTRQTISYTVMRKDDAGTLKETELSTPVKQIEIVRKHILSFNPEASPAQLALRDSWLKP